MAWSAITCLTVSSISRHFRSARSRRPPNRRKSRFDVKSVALFAGFGIVMSKWGMGLDMRFFTFVRIASAVALTCVMSAHAQTKPFVPSWKYHAYHISVDVAPDGGTTTNYETVFTILDESAIDRMREQSITYHEHDGTLE